MISKTLGYLIIYEKAFLIKFLMTFWITNFQKIYNIFGESENIVAT